MQPPPDGLPVAGSEAKASSAKWTAAGTLLPLAIPFLVTFAVAQGMRFVAGQ